MSIRSTGQVVVHADPRAVMDVLLDVEEWPTWSSTHRRVEVLDLDEDGLPARLRVAVSVAGISDEQVLDYTWDGDAGCSWTLVSGGQARSQTGSYRLSADGPRTTVTYVLDVEPRLPVPGLIVRQAQKKVVSAATSGLKKAVESRSTRPS
ncbi:MAG: cyclase/dehydrase [Frankiales bacterium]|nr:cyclase/dehydrase [Frankiales bacterium]